MLADIDLKLKSKKQ
jgi:tRNA A-37 threonylcarbamoyl transferase component Bud32